MSDPALRASDADRERTVERLREAAGEGRLGADELEDRLERALTARTYADLDALLADLPRRRTSGRGAPHRGAHGRRAERRAFFATSILLVAIWALTGMGYFWPVWPIVGWGVFVLGPAKAGLGCGHARRHRSRSRSARGTV